MKIDNIGKIAIIYGNVVNRLGKDDVTENERITLVSVRDELLKILNDESNALKSKKFDIWKCVSKDTLRPVMNGVHYLKGYAVASNGSVLVCCKDEHPADWNMTTRAKDGTEIEGKYPDWQSVIPIEGGEFFAINTRAIQDASTELTLAKKTNKKASAYIKVGSDELHAYIKLERLLLAKSFCETYGFDFGAYVYKQNGCIKYGSRDGLGNIMIIMPCNHDSNDDFIIE